jgi:replication-associated recombination protein RarA
MAYYNREPIPPTEHGYDRYEAISAMQKCIRRGMEVEAMVFAMSLFSCGWHRAAINRIRVTAHEDIGTADMEAVMFACSALDQCQIWHEAGKTSWRLCLANAVLSLCRAKKSRQGDTLQAAVRNILLHPAKRPEMPDFALDKHTRRGKKMGRGIDHFRKEGAVLKPDPEPDPFEELAYEFWGNNMMKLEKKAQQRPAETDENKLF